MEATVVDTRDIIERMIKKDPTVSAAEIARKADVSRERVSQLLRDMDYELQKVWRKVKRRKE